jgi:cell division protein FtsQ
MALVVFLGLVAVVVAALYTPLLGVRSVEVSGNVVLTSTQVSSAAEVSMGMPMLRLDTGSIRTRVAALPRVATVDVVREWPATVLIEVTERQAAATFAGPGGVHLVDSTGVDFATVPTAPPNLPTLTVGHVAPTDPATKAVFAVLAAMPSQLRPELVNIGASTPGGVTFTLNTGKTVIWGDAGDSAHKATVLAALLSQPGKVYDVSAPDLPTVSS